MRGGAAKAIQELAGHTHLSTTMRYAHLSPDVKRDAVQLLDFPAPRAPSPQPSPRFAGAREKSGHMWGTWRAEDEEPAAEAGG